MTPPGSRPRRAGATKAAPKPAPRPTIAVVVQGRAGARVAPPLRSRVRRWATRMLLQAGAPAGELSVVLTDDDAIWELNRSYRGKDKPTDVLAFALQEGQGGTLWPGLLGDVVISVETANRQRGRRTLDSELLHLLAHGVSHLLGYDHQTDAQEAEMKAHERLLRTAAAPRMVGN